MLDQLVAFCGEKIGETDVLNVFGFTSEQTVADLTGHILRGKTADAIDLLNQQCDAGKDMMRLMSDLIAHLRDLLVFKAKPDALNEEIDSGVQESLAAQGELIDTGRLLELIDQFAEAEGRMKWVPNKKLYFEVAIIKAIQSLSQATLDEVIQKLGDLRGGKPVAGGADAGRAEQPRPTAAGINATGYNAEKTPVAEANLDPGEIWKRLSAKIPAQKGFLRNAAAAAHVLGIEGRNFLLGFSPDDKSLMDILATPANRKFVEEALGEIAGRDLSAKITIDEQLSPRSVSNPPAITSTAGFTDDPLIQEAVEIFNGKIRS
jgi:DNA polymerase-3 subunit gamma/tau